MKIRRGTFGETAASSAARPRDSQTSGISLITSGSLFSEGEIECKTELTELRQ